MTWQNWYLWQLPPIIVSETLLHLSCLLCTSVIIQFLVHFCVCPIFSMLLFVLPYCTSVYFISTVLQLFCFRYNILFALFHSTSLCGLFRIHLCFQFISVCPLFMHFCNCLIIFILGHFSSFWWTSVFANFDTLLYLPHFQCIFLLPGFWCNSAVVLFSVHFTVYFSVCPFSVHFSVLLPLHFCICPLYLWTFLSCFLKHFSVIPLFSVLLHLSSFQYTSHFVLCPDITILVHWA